ncbi:MAG TPA: uracil-DNA glycosylase family protein, partial [Geobacteraceae bacterium]
MSVRPILAEYLEYLRDAGVTEQWGPGGPCLKKEEKSSTSDKPLLQFKSLSEVREYLGVCTRCKLHAGRTNIVFGVGDPNAKLVFVGEGPGRDEDLQGEPFVGKA